MSRMKKYFCVLLALFSVGFFGFTYFRDFAPLKLRGWNVAGSGLQSAGVVASGLLKNLITGSLNETGELPECPETPPTLLGPKNLNFSLDLSLEDIVFAYPNVEVGGHYKPFDCVARQRIAIIIPFRKRETHLKIWLFYMHQFLQRQQGDYIVYVIEQHGDLRFNRAKLMNVGFTEALKNYNHSCFIFSDIDIVPMDDRNYYRCYGNPRHMSNSLDKHNFRLLYATIFGGVNAFSKEQFLKVNGFSNQFWGWGGEDDELYIRVVETGMRVERPDSVIARSRMIPHKRDPGNESNRKNSGLVYQAKKNMHIDGLNSLKYNVVNITRHPLYTKITVDIGEPEQSKLTTVEANRTKADALNHVLVKD